MPEDIMDMCDSVELTPAAQGKARAMTLRKLHELSLSLSLSLALSLSLSLSMCLSVFLSLCLSVALSL